MSKKVGVKKLSSTRLSQKCEKTINISWQLLTGEKCFEGWKMRMGKFHPWWLCKNLIYLMVKLNTQHIWLNRNFNRAQTYTIRRRRLHYTMIRKWFNDFYCFLLRWLMTYFDTADSDDKVIIELKVNDENVSLLMKDVRYWIIY